MVLGSGRWVDVAPVTPKPCGVGGSEETYIRSIGIWGGKGATSPSILDYRLTEGWLYPLIILPIGCLWGHQRHNYQETGGWDFSNCIFHQHRDVVIFLVGIASKELNTVLGPMVVG